MKKRLMIGLAAGALVAAMLPGVTSAAPPGNREGNGAQFSAVTSCELKAGGTILTFPLATWAGIQGQVQRAFNAFAEASGGCVPGTKTVTITKIS